MLGYYVFYVKMFVAYGCPLKASPLTPLHKRGEHRQRFIKVVPKFFPLGEGFRMGLGTRAKSGGVLILNQTINT